MAWFFGIYLIGRRISGDTLGILGALITATTAGAFVFTHMVMPEGFLALFLTFTFWCFISSYRFPNRSRAWMTAAWVFMALGCFSKGLHGAAYPLLTAGWVAWRHPEHRSIWKQLIQPAGITIFVLILVPWYIYVESQLPGFLFDQFVNEQLGHVVNRRHPLDSHRVPAAIFCVQHLIYLFPWTLFAITARWSWKWLRLRSPRAAASTLQPTENHLPSVNEFAWTVLWSWLGITLVTLVFSSLQDYYSMTCWGVLGLWLAQRWAGKLSDATDPSKALPAWRYYAPVLTLAIIGAGLLVVDHYLQDSIAATESAAALPAASTTTTPTALRDTLIKTVAGFSPDIWKQLLPLAWATGAALFMGGLTATVFVYLRNRRPYAKVLTIFTVAATMILVLTMATDGMNVIENQLSLKQAALAIIKMAEPDAMVACQGLPSDNPSLLFYLIAASFGSNPIRSSNSPRGFTTSECRYF